MKFKASLDTLSKGITFTIAVFGLVLFIMALTVYKNDYYLLLFPVTILLLTLALTYIYAPRAYEITNDSIEVIRGINKFHIARKEILSIEKLDQDQMGRAWRIFGNGGMFGYTGWFSSTTQGRMRWFVSQRKNYIAIVLHDHKKYILSPDDADGFMQSTQY